jgi:ribonucleoside-diphosphate reductase alpha chain
MTDELPSLYQQYIHISRYSRWLHEEKRRETWPETVSRYFDFFEEHLKERCDYTLTPKLKEQLKDSVQKLEVMPSMRALMTAGPALKRDELSGYNCSFVAIDNVRAFDEILFILMVGCGVGFSVERKYVNKLPDVPDELYNTDTTIVVADSKIGWAKAYKELISMLYAGQIPKWDMSKVRPGGAPLKTFGGRASGPEPLQELFETTIRTFKEAKGRKLNSLECHDIICTIGSIVVVGGVRRSALISLSNLSDDRMRNAKNGQWWLTEGQRYLANNSVAYTEKPDIGIFLDEWKALYDSKSGERGIFNRTSAQKQCEKFERRDPNHDFGTNPCGEIILRSNQLCNLSEVVIRPDDTFETLKAKVEAATILGTFQSTLTKFRYVSKKWTNNCEEERLLGVSLTGIMDHPILSKVCDTAKEWLQKLRDFAIEVNKKLAQKLGIPQSTMVTTVKPSGTVSQLVDSSSGIHGRYSEYYIRTIRADNKDPVCQLMKDLNFPHEPCIDKGDSVTVFSFPVKSPKQSRVASEMDVIEQLEIWKMYKDYWTEHNPSCTIYVDEHEWLRAASFIYDNFEEIGGVSFLPYDGHIYKQAPYQPCSKEDYEEFKKKMPKSIDWSKLCDYEDTDLTAGAQTMSCTGGSCEIVDLV